MIGYPALVFGTLMAYLRVSDGMRSFVKGAFGIGILGECGVLSGAIHFTQSGVSMLGGLIV